MNEWPQENRAVFKESKDAGKGHSEYGGRINEKSQFDWNRNWIFTRKVCKELFLRVYCIEENNPTWTKIEAGLMQGIILVSRSSVVENDAASNRSYNDENNALLK